MADSRGHTETSGRRESRRRFFRLLAGSPLLAAAYPALPPSWQEAVAREARHSTPTGLQPAGIPCPDCGQEMVTPSPAGPPPFAQQTAAAPPDRNRFLEGQLSGQVVEAPELAVNVWDMEMTTHAQNLPEHWAYLHLGVDDFETRRANREGFQRLMLRPRRLGQDTSNLDISMEMFGRRWESPLFLCPVGRPQGLSHAGRGRGRAGGSREGDPADAVPRQLAVVRGDRGGAGRAALVPALFRVLTGT